VAFFGLRLAKERDKALAEAARTRRIQRFTLDLFGNEDQQAAPSQDLTVLAAADRWAEGLASLSADPETEIELYLTLGRVYEQLNQFPKAERFLQLGLAEAKRRGSETPQTLNALVQLGLLRGDQAQFPEAKRLLQEALSVAKRLRLGTEDPQMVNVQGALGRVLVQSGASDQAIALLEPIVQRPASGEEGKIYLLENLTALAVAEQYVGHYDTAESLNRRALELDRRMHGNTHPRVATDLANIAAAELSLGHYSQAEEMYREGAGILGALYGPENAEVVQIKSLIAVAEMRAGKSVEAEELLRDLLPIEERAYGTSLHPNVAFAHRTLGQLAESRGNLAEAETEYGRSVEIDQKLFGASDYQTAFSTSDLAGILVKEGRYAEAERIVRPAVTALTARPLPGNMNVGIAQLNLGEAVLKQKRYQEAVEPLTTAYEILKAGSGAPKGRLEQAGADLVLAYEALHKPDLAAKFRPQPSAQQGH
jgi:serine/threonine-protein kinase